mgnify:CR=1 FL=1
MNNPRDKIIDDYLKNSACSLDDGFADRVIDRINHNEKNNPNKRNVLTNFPVLGYFRYFFELISPEIQQYFIERNTDGKPFSRNHRALVYKRAKGVNDTYPFGTQSEILDDHYEGLRHSIYAKEPVEEFPRVIVGSSLCKQPYSASVLNVFAIVSFANQPV